MIVERAELRVTDSSGRFESCCDRLSVIPRLPGTSLPHRMAAIGLASGRTVMHIVLKTIITLLACLAAADLAGIAVCALLGLAPLSSGRAPLPLAIWFVLGVLSGLAAFSAVRGGDRTAFIDAPKTLNLVTATAFFTLFALAVLFHAFWWGRGVAGEYFVPGSAPHTMLMLAATAFAIAIARVSRMPKLG